MEMSGNGGYHSESEIDSDIENLLYSQLHYSTEVVVNENSELVLENDYNDDMDHNHDQAAEIKANTPEKLKDPKDDWAIHEKDLQGAEQYNRSLSNVPRYYIDKQERGPTCFSCKCRGHLSRDCPQPLKKENCYLCGEFGHFRRDCPNDVCYNCHEVGHISKFCTEHKRNNYAVCKRCWGRGHNKFSCPEIWRQFHLTVKDNDRIVKPKMGKNGSLANIKEVRYCYFCGLEGHFGHDCRDNRRNRRPVTSPFIVYYDKCPYKSPREKQVKSVVKETSGERYSQPSAKTKDDKIKYNEFREPELKDRKNHVNNVTEKPLDDRRREEKKHSSSKHVTLMAESADKSEESSDKTSNDDCSNERSGQKNNRRETFVKESDRREELRKDLTKSGSKNGKRERDQARRLETKQRNNDSAIERIVISSDGCDSDLPDSSRRDSRKRAKTVDMMNGRNGIINGSVRPDSILSSSKETKGSNFLGYIDDRKMKNKAMKDDISSSYTVKSSNGCRQTTLNKAVGDNKKDKITTVVLSSDSADNCELYPRQVMSEALSEKSSNHVAIRRHHTEVCDAGNETGLRKRKWRAKDVVEGSEEVARKKVNRGGIRDLLEKDQSGKGVKNAPIWSSEEMKSQANDTFNDDYIALDVYQSFSGEKSVSVGEAEGSRNINGKRKEKQISEKQSKLEIQTNIKPLNMTDNRWITRSDGERNLAAPGNKNLRNAKDASNRSQVHPERRVNVAGSENPSGKSTLTASSFIPIATDKERKQGKASSKYKESKNCSTVEETSEREQMHPERKSRVGAFKGFNVKATKSAPPSSIEFYNREYEHHAADTAGSKQSPSEQNEEAFDGPRPERQNIIISSEERSTARNRKKRANRKANQEAKKLRFSKDLSDDNFANGSIRQEPSFEVADSDSYKLNRENNMNTLDNSKQRRDGINTGGYHARIGGNLGQNHHQLPNDFRRHDGMIEGQKHHVIHVDDGSSNEEENFQFSNLLIHQDEEMSPEEGDLRSTINTLKAKRKPPASVTGDTSRENSTWRPRNGEVKDFYGDRETSKHDELSVEFMNKFLYGDQEEIDFTKYDPHSAYDEDLSYYGLSGSSKQNSRQDERFKEPEHIVFVEDDDDDEDGLSKVSPKTSKFIAKPKVNRLQSTSTPKHINTYKPVILNHSQSRSKEASPWENTSIQAFDNGKFGGENDTSFEEVALGLLSDPESVDISRLPASLRRQAKEYKRKLKEKRSDASMQKVRSNWRRWVRQNEATKYFPDLQERSQGGDSWLMKNIMLNNPSDSTKKSCKKGRKYGRKRIAKNQSASSGKSSSMKSEDKKPKNLDANARNKGPRRGFKTSSKAKSILHGSYL